MKLCTTLGDFLPYTGSWKKSVEAMKDTGFKCLDFYCFEEITPDACILASNWKENVIETKETADRLGMKFVQAHAPQTKFELDEFSEASLLTVEGFKRAIEACSILGVKNLVCHACRNDVYLYSPEYKEEYFTFNRKFFSKILSSAEKYGVNLLIENSSPILMKGKYSPMTGNDLIELIHAINHPMVHAVWDTGHANMRGVDQYQDLKDLGTELRALHVQDNFGTPDVHVAPFMGIVNMDSIMTAITELGSIEYFTFEAVNIIASANPNAYIPRNKTLDWIEPKLSSPDLNLRIEAEKFMYEIGKFILSQYNCFEY